MFRKYMDEESKLTPLQRTEWRIMSRQYVKMMELDYKTQDRYEAEVAQLRRQVNSQAETIRLKDKTIHEGADDETPLPLLDMMNRLSAVEEKYEALRARVAKCLCDDPDIADLSQLGNDIWKELNPGANEKKKCMTQQDIFDNLIQASLDTEEVVSASAYRELEEEKDEIEGERDEMNFTADNWHKQYTEAKWEAVKLGEQLDNIPAWAKKTPKSLGILGNFMERSESWGPYRDFVKEYYPEEPTTDSEEEEEDDQVVEDPVNDEPEPETASEGITDFLMDNFPEIQSVPKMKKFMSQRGHIKMEQADMKNATHWFAEMKKRGYLPAMNKHREMTNIFDWTNYDRWVKSQK